VDVIQSMPRCRVVFFVGDQNENVTVEWLLKHGAELPDLSALQSQIDICEYSGLEAISQYLVDLGDDFYALKAFRKGGINPSPIFRKGPFNETEITFLAGARMIGKNVRPHSALGTAQDNLETLLAQPWRKRRERID
jgi:hypothetical protein